VSLVSRSYLWVVSCVSVSGRVSLGRILSPWVMFFVSGSYLVSLGLISGLCLKSVGRVVCLWVGS
jgi:hypothetical protein